MELFDAFFADYPGNQGRTGPDYAAAIIPVSDPPMGFISIYLRRHESDCLRIYTIGPGLTLDEATWFTQIFVDSARVG